MTKTIMYCSILGLLCLMIGVILMSVRSTIMDMLIKNNLALKPGSKGYAMWKDLPVPITASLYLFNCTNPVNVTNGELPILQQVGPYVFMEYHHKTNEVWNDNGTVTYEQIRTWKFNPSLTVGSLDDIITTLNPPAATTAAMAMQLNIFERVILSATLGIINEKMFVDKSAREILFDGYSDPILTTSKLLPKNITPGRTDKFAYYYERNGSATYDGVFNVFSGELDMETFDTVHTWNYYERTPFFRGNCGDVRGSAEMFPPSVDASGVVELYLNDLCRPLTLTYAPADLPVTVGGVLGLKFVMDKSFMANASLNPDNACYVDPASAELPGGLFNISSCRFGAPVFISQPHFYQADAFYSSRIQQGMAPSEQLHATEFVVEPTSGAPMSIKARFQINFLIQPVSDIALFSKLPRVFFPTAWFDNTMQLPPALLKQLNILANLKYIFTVVASLLIAVGCVIIMIGVVVYYELWNRLVVLVTPTDVEESPTDVEESNLIPNSD